MNEPYFKCNYFIKRWTEFFMVRLMRFGLLSALAFCALFGAGLHAHAAVSGDFEYTDNVDGTVTITHYFDPVKYDNHLVVPAQLDGKTVTAIGDQAFRYAFIFGVTLPDTIKSIGKEAFELTRVLKDVKLPSGLVSIGDYAFNYNRIEQITLPESLEHIGFSAFSYNKLKSVSFPSGLKTMKPFAFWHNEITSVSFPESMTMTKIPEHTFIENKITSVTIPKYITEIEFHAFSANPITDVKILSAATQLRRNSFLEIGSPVTIYGHSESPAQRFAFTNGYLFEPFKMKVTYDGNGHISGNIPTDDNLYVRGERAKVSGNTGMMERPGYRFSGWNTSADSGGVDYAIDSLLTIQEDDVVLFAKWEQVWHTITFDTKGGSAISSQVLADNMLASEPNTPTKLGYTFEGWYLDEDFMTKWNFAVDKVTADIILYAKWTANNYTVTFESNGGSNVSEQQVPYNEKAITPPVPSKQGHTFEGWYKDSRLTAKWDFETDVVTAAITLYAKWTVNSSTPPTNGGGNPPLPTDSNDNTNSNMPSAEVKIDLHTNGGTTPALIDITYNTKIGDLPVPTREGYRFDGWYQDEALTKPWSADTLLYENITLYAKWTALSVDESDTVTFSDIERHWAKAMIEELASKGIIQGYEDGTFHPNEPISRMHVAVIVGRAFTFEPKRKAKNFSDVPQTHPYYEAIMALQQAGIVDGSNGAFLPAENMTRAQMAKVLVGLMGRTPTGISSFVDVDQKHWSAGYIAVLEQEGIALGDNGKFRPNEPVTRAQFIAFLYRMMQIKK